MRCNVEATVRQGLLAVTRRLKDETGTGYAYDFENKLVTVFDDADSNGVLNGGETVMAGHAYDALERRVEFINDFDQR